MKSVILEVDCGYVHPRVPAIIDGRKVIIDIDDLYELLYIVSGSNGCGHVDPKIYAEEVVEWVSPLGEPYSMPYSGFETPKVKRYRL
ncbi:MAG: hypothetical protein QXE23_07570 [Nitrososphaerota archaeon]